jgi:hypothetical protein
VGVTLVPQEKWEIVHKQLDSGRIPVYNEPMTNHLIRKLAVAWLGLALFDLLAAATFGFVKAGGQNMATGR